MERALVYLARSQNTDGSWTPLWFGNEQGPDESNPTYGTASVLLALEELRLLGFRLPPEIAQRATDWLLAAQDSSGAWGGAAGTAVSTEETGLAVEALASCAPESATRGALWLASKIEDDSWTVPSPIGFYFAKLWYYEALYPQIFTVAGLGRLLRHL
jgi:squalene-hopene/tetraprenyl-beta-curcumene cyclase